MPLRPDDIIALEIFFFNLNQSEYRVVNQQTVTACLIFSDIYIVAVTAETKTVEI